MRLFLSFVLGEEIAMKLNVLKKAEPVFTHEGAPAVRNKSPLDELKRTVMACLLWEKGFYEDGEAVADRIKRLVPLCKPEEVAALAMRARGEQNLRHVPLLLMRELARAGTLRGAWLASVIQRADEPGEYVAIYWKDGRQTLSKQSLVGLRMAFQKFNRYHLSKYAAGGAVRLRDVMFLCHPSPKDEAQADDWKLLAADTLPPAETWEAGLSGGGDKREVFEDLLRRGKLGYLAVLRNLRNMRDAGVDTTLVFPALAEGSGRNRVLPFRFVAAARAVPQWEPHINAAMQTSLAGMPKMEGKTVVLVDVSGSMDYKLSAKSDLTRLDAASALAVLLRGVCGDGECRVFTFSQHTVEVPPRHGMALVDAIAKSQTHSSTYLGQAVETVNEAGWADRLVVVTDEQSYDRVGAAAAGKAYMVNVASNQNGVGFGDWVRINGWSEAVVQYIQELEKGAA
jgi:60 kDa SS-A/Ro ribonucleoprotein